MSDDVTRPVWIRGPQLRKRWGNGEEPMPNSTFFDRLQKGLIPEPEYPFGPGTPPYWRLAKIEEHERKSQGTPAAPPPPEDPALKRKPGRPRKATSAPGPGGQHTTASHKRPTRAQAESSEVAP